MIRTALFLSLMLPVLAVLVVVIMGLQALNAVLGPGGTHY